MTPTEIEAATRTLGAPAGWDDKAGVECEPLHIRDAADSAGNNVMQSWWQPNEEEKRAIAEGKPITLTIWGRGHPPVWVHVDL